MYFSEKKKEIKCFAIFQQFIALLEISKIINCTVPSHPLLLIKQLCMDINI
jgi:hypothetical protein